jgi:hypothetical protein
METFAIVLADLNQFDAVVEIANIPNNAAGNQLEAAF